MFGLRIVPWPGREFAIAHRPQLPAQSLLGDGDAELLEDPLCQIDQPPSYHSMDSRNGTTINHLSDCPALTIIEFGGLTWRLTIPQTIGALRIEP